MKYFILISIFFNISVLADVISPSWYPKKTNTYKIHSYGKTIDEAKINATQKIQNDLNVTQVNVSDFVILRKELFENKIFIELEYINESIENQIKNKIKTYAFKQEVLANTLMQNTVFFNEIYNEFGYYPNIELHDNFLYFNNNKFLIKKHELPKFYSTFINENITLDIKDELQSQENFFIEVDTSYEGYLTLVRIYKGEFAILFKNKETKNSIIFPNFKISDGMQINLDDSSYDEDLLTLAVVCSEIKDFSSYSMLLDIKDGTNVMTFSDFINEVSNCKITSKTTKIIK